MIDDLAVQLLKEAEQDNDASFEAAVYLILERAWDRGYELGREREYELQQEYLNIGREDG